jgi:surface protein
VIEAQSFEAAEDIADTDVIGTVAATDPEQDALTFSISVNDDDIFEIDASSGELSLAEGKTLDFETAEGHTITVAVTDGVNDPVSAEITITVTAVYESLADDPASFVTTWVTTVNNETIKIGMNPDYDEYDYTIDWGDGTVEDITNADFINYTVQHEYAEAGTYTVAIKGTFPAIFMDVNAGIVTQADALKLASIEQWGSNPWANMYGAFAGCGNMVYNATDVPDLSQVTHMGSMFSGAEAFNGDLSGWDVSNVTDMSSMFNDAVAFEGIGLSGWDVSSVTDMSYMFAYTDTFNGDISGWDVSSVTDMSYMFAYTNAFNGDLSGWDVSNVTNMSYMFSDADAFNGNISSWDVSSVTNMSYMFLDADSFNGDISGWDTRSVTDMNTMFAFAIAFNRDLGAWDIGSVTDMASMLSGSGLSSENYSNTLTGWANYVDTNNGPSNINLGATDLQYCNTSAGGSRIFLESVYDWNIIGDSIDPNCN